MGLLRRFFNFKNITSQLRNPKIVSILLGGIFFSFLLGIIFRNQISTFFSSNPGAAPVVYWKFDEGQGSTANDFISTNDGTLGTGNSAPTWISKDQCISGNCLKFDGTSDVVVMNDIASVENRNSLTISFWIKPTSAILNHKFIVSKVNASAGSWTINTAQTGDASRIAFSICTIANCSTLSTGYTTNSVLSVSEWTFMSFVYDGAQGTNENRIKIYKNGKLQQITTSGTIPTSIQNSSANVLVGGLDVASTYTFVGAIDEVKIYDYVRTPAQVQADFVSRGSTKGIAVQFGDGDMERKLSNGLVGYWKMDEIGVSGAGWTATDSSGNNNNGTGAGNASVGSTEPGKFGNGGFFDGSGDQVVVPDSSSMDVGPQATWAAWFKLNTLPSVTGNTYRIIDKYVGTGDQRSYQLYIATTDKLHMVIDSTGLGTAEVDVAGDNALSPDIWYHVVAVADGTKAYMYVDNVKQSDVETINAVYASTANIYIGSDTNTLYFKGSLDEVRIYNRALDPSEVKDLYEWAPGPVGYWKMDENSGTSALEDSSGKSNSLTLSNIQESSWMQGKYGAALKFNSASSQYASRADSTSLSIGGDLTINAWIKPNAITASTEFPIAGKTENDTRSYLLTQYGDEIRMYIGSANNYITTNSVNLSTGTWYHVEGVYKASSQTITIYINSSAVNTTTTGTIPTSIADSTDVFNIAHAQSGSETTVNYQVGASSDDADQNLNGIPGNITRVGVRVGNDSNAKIAGFRFTNITIPQGSTISSATFTPTSNDTYNCGGCTLSARVHLENTNDSATFTTAGSNISGRSRTTANTVWNLTSLVNGVQYPVTVTSAVQEVINRVGWSSGNDMAVLAVDNSSSGSEWQEMTAYDSNPSNAARLSITYSTLATRYYDGIIDDVKIYNYARTPAQIIQDMNAGHPAPGSPVGSAAAHWKMDEGYGTVINNSGNVGIGLSGVFATGSSAPVWSNDGKFGKAISFDGTNDYITVGNTMSLRIEFPFTVSSWINMDSLPTSEGAIISKYYAFSNAREWRFFIDSSDQKMKFSVSTSGTSGTNTTVAASTAFTSTDIGKWNHVLLSADASGNYTFYKNAQSLGSGTFPSTTIFHGVALPMIGAVNYSTANPSAFFDGKIDEVKIYNLAFNPDQVKAEYNAGQAQVMGAGSTGVGGTSPSNSASREYCVPGDSSTCNAPVGEWKFDKIGSTAYDTSGNGYAGTLDTTMGRSNWIPGKIGKSLSFDGVDDDVQMSSAVVTAYPFSMSGWFKTSTSSSAYLVTLGSSNSSNNFQGIRIFSGQLYARSVESSNASDAITSDTYNDNNWHHVSAVFTSATDRKIYVDGILENTDTTSRTFSASINRTALGGVNNNSETPASNFTGVLDDIKIFNYARTPAQIAWEYNKGKSLGYWKMDECTGTNIKDWGQNANGGFNGNNGTLNLGASGVTSAGTCSTSGAWANGATGKIGASLSFDGSSDYVEIADTSNLDFGNDEDMSLTFWMKPSTLSTAKTIIAKKTGNTAGLSGYMVQTFAGAGVGFYLADVSLSNQVLTTTTTTLTVGQWTHVAIVYDAKSIPKIYFNGSQVSTSISGGGTISTMGSLANASPLVLGAESDNQLNYYGQLDEVKLYRYTLTPAQIKTDLNSGAVRFQ